MKIKTVKSIELTVLTEGFLVSVESEVPCDCGDDECTLTNDYSRRFAFTDYKSAVNKMFEFEQHALNIQSDRKSENEGELN